jgi:hypothetical protein
VLMGVNCMRAVTEADQSTARKEKV